MNLTGCLFYISIGFLWDSYRTYMSLGFLWYFPEKNYDIVMVSLWHSYRIPMTFQMDVYDISLGLLWFVQWDSYGIPMGFLWCFYDISMGLLQDFWGDSTGFLLDVFVVPMLVPCFFLYDHSIRFLWDATSVGLLWDVNWK